MQNTFRAYDYAGKRYLWLHQEGDRVGVNLCPVRLAQTHYVPTFASWGLSLCVKYTDTEYLNASAPPTPVSAPTPVHAELFRRQHDPGQRSWRRLEQRFTIYFRVHVIVVRP
jgi:hypothetical protein